MSNIIKAIRKLRGYTQEEVALKLGMSPRTYCKKEADPESFKISEMKKLAEVLNVDIANFFENKVTILAT